MASVSRTSPITSSEDSQNSSETDLNINNMEGEIHTDAIKEGNNNQFI